MRRSLVVMAGVVTLSVVLAFVVPLWWLVGRFASERALTEARQPAVALAPAMATRDLDEVTFVHAFLDRDGVTVVMFDGRVIGAPVPPGADLERAKAGESFELGVPEGVLVHQPVRVDDETGVVVVAVPRAEIVQGVGRARLIILTIAVLLISMAIWLADRLGRRITAPAAAAADIARQLSDGHLDARVEVDGPPELQDVGVALNRLAGRIGELLASERERAADLAHRLRTPMQALRFEADRVRPVRTRDEIVEALQAVDDQVTRLIHEMRGAGPVAVARPRPLAEVVGERAQFWQVLAEGDGREFVVDVDRRLARQVPGADITVVVDVLAGNVLAHTPPGTAARISLRREGDEAVLRVEDEGPGIAPGLGQRGASGDGSSGLGLDIARRKIASIGGRFSVGATPTGGACVEVRLPLLADGPPSMTPNGHVHVAGMGSGR